MKITAAVRALVVDVRANLTENPWRLVPHFCRPVRHGPGDGYSCGWCGSRSARVQRKGQARAERLRREWIP